MHIDVLTFNTTLRILQYSSTRLLGSARSRIKTVIETAGSGNQLIQEKMDLLDDKKDIPVALGALNHGIDYLVTGDKELLEKESLPSITTKNLLKQILPESS